MFSKLMQEKEKQMLVILYLFISILIYKIEWRMEKRAINILRKITELDAI